MSDTIVISTGLRRPASFSLAAPFRAVWNLLVALAESGPRMQAIRKLNATTDEELAARGLTRAGEVRRIFADRMYL